MWCLRIACAIVIASGALAHADGVGVVAVASTAGDRAAIAGAVAAAAQADPAHPVRVSADALTEAREALAAGAVPAATLARFRRVREQIDEGWRAFNRVQIELAASRLASARTDAESIVALPGGDALYADASLRLGAVLGHLGRDDESHAAIALALALDPDRPITLAEFSPDVVAAVDAVRAQTRPTRTVKLASEPAGAVLSVDGKDVGAGPVALELALGQHVVIARMAMHETRGQAFDVTASSGDLSLALAEDRAAERLAEGARVGLPDAAAQELSDATIRYAELDDLVLVVGTERRGGPALLVQRCAGLPAKCSAVVEVGYNDRSGLGAAAREAWQTVRAADLRYPPSVLADPRTSGKAAGDDHRCKLCRSPVLWGSVGAAALIGTIVIIAVTSGSRPPPIVGADPDNF